MFGYAAAVCVACVSGRLMVWAKLNEVNVFMRHAPLVLSLLGSESYALAPAPCRVVVALRRDARTDLDILPKWRLPVAK